MDYILHLILNQQNLPFIFIDLYFNFIVKQMIILMITIIQFTLHFISILNQIFIFDPQNILMFYFPRTILDLIHQNDCINYKLII